MGLTPRHDVPVKKYDWDWLDKSLKANIDNNTTDHRSLTIKISDYLPHEDEIKSELTKNGYHFEDITNGYLRIY